MYTKTITLSGAALSSFLAAGGQTVNPDAPVAAAATTAAAVSQVPFPVAVEATTSTSAAPTTTTSPRAGFTTTTSSSTTSSSTSTSSSMTSSSSSTAVKSTSAAVSSAKASTTQAPSSTTTSSKAATTSARASSVRSVASSALTSAKSKSVSKGIGGGGIAGIIIGLLILAAVIAALVFFWRKRRNERREEEYAEKSRRDVRNEKGMVRLEEEEVSTPTGGGGFDFGHLPPIAPTPPISYDNGDFVRSASPAQMQQGAAVLGIQRPFTPPPGHPAHPNYRQPPALAANRLAQQPVPQGARSITPQNAAIMPRRPIPANVAPMQRKLSSNNPFSDPIVAPEIAPPLARATTPVQPSHPVPVVSMPRIASPAPESNPAQTADPRASMHSFTAGDDSFHGQEAVVAPSPANEAVRPRTQTPVQPEAIPIPPQPSATSDATVTDDDAVVRSKSVMKASDNWAARKAHLKNTLALQTASNPTSPVAEQSPFADPAPTIDHEIAVGSPMQMNFDRDVEKI